MNLDLLLYLGMFVGSLALLLKASDLFVDSAEEIGLSFGVSPFIIGVTIVAFGTSLPELASSIAAILSGDPEIVIGNVVGSNIANICLIMGITAIIAKEIKLDFTVLDVDIPFLVGSAFFLWLSCADLKISPFEVFIFLACLVLFLVNSFKREERADKNARPEAGWRAYGLLILGGFLVYLSADWTIVAIQRMSELAAINPEFIALTLVAFGTSLPEIAVSIAAARKNKTAIAVGNVVGSNIFNSLAVMGIPSLFGAIVIPASILSFSLPFMIIATLMFTVLSFSRVISRWEGIMLILFYAYFIGQVFEKAMT